MKRLVLFVFALGLFASCEPGESTETNTERFYRTPWNVEINRTHNAVGTLAAADEDHSGKVTLAKGGDFLYNISALNDHKYQWWGYSWSTDQFYMNWSPCLDWYINEEADSMYLNYDHYDYDPNSGNSFYWNYSVYMTK
jgi:hypothetical protein